MPQLYVSLFYIVATDFTRLNKYIIHKVSAYQIEHLGNLPHATGASDLTKLLDNNKQSNYLIKY